MPKLYFGKHNMHRILSLPNVKTHAPNSDSSPMTFSVFENLDIYKRKIKGDRLKSKVQTGYTWVRLNVNSVSRGKEMINFFVV